MLPLAALALLCCLSSTQAEEPLLQVLVTSPGLNKVGEVGVEFFSEIFPGMSVSSLEGDYNCPPLGLVCLGNVHWYVRDVTFYEINLPTTTVVTDPDAERFRWSVNNASFLARGYLNYTYHILFGLVVVSNSVPFNLSVSGADITVNVTVTKNFLGLPRVDVLGCKCVIHTTTVHFGTLVPGLVYNLFNQAIAEDLKEALQVKVCEGAMHTVDTHANEVLGTTSLDLPIGGPNGIYVSCKLRDNPSLLTELVKAPIVCQVSLPGSDPITFTPSPMPAITTPDKMLVTAISVELLNMVLAQLYESHKFDFIVDESNSHPDTFMKTTDCAVDVPCIGTLFPEIAANYSGWKIEIVVKELEPRKFFISTTDIRSVSRSNAEIKAINTTSDEIVSLYNFTFTRTRYCRFVLVGLDLQQTSLNLVFSPIDIEPAYEDSTGTDIFLNFVTNNLGYRVGPISGGVLSLPKTNGMAWINPEITLIDGAILFHTDVVFTPF
jgi:hypothetical protein